MTSQANPDHPLILRLKDEGDYYERFLRLDKYMNEEVHPRVTAGTAANDAGVWLTDHGPRHIARVIERIGDLADRNGDWAVSPHESYLLAIAAHCHDVGNVFGRENHEKMARAILFGLDEELIGKDTAEKRLICDIAKAHSGKTSPNGDKDTIGNLPHPPRIKKLAAILRFADELADDHGRTTAIDRMVLDANAELKGNSEIFHLYAERLRNVAVEHGSHGIHLRFELLVDHLTHRYGKNGSRAFLLDEIFERTLKMHREQVYCGRFMVPDIVSERIQVKIQICGDRYQSVIGSIPYVLEQKGYPGHIDKIVSVAPQLTGLTGANVALRADQLRAIEPREYEQPPNLIPKLKIET